MTALRMRFFGGIRIDQGQNLISNELAGKALALLCYLVVTKEQQTRNSLSSLLWSDFPEHRARSNLRDTLTSLRRTPLAPYLNIERKLIAFNPRLPHWLDIQAFEEGIESGIGNDAINAGILERAIGNYKGEFLAGFQIAKAVLFEEWATIQRQQLHLRVVGALQQLVEYHLDAGNYDNGISSACRLLDLDPWREETHRNLMLLHFLKGDANEALRQFESCREFLDEELGVAPSQETLTLYQNIRSQIGNNGLAGGYHVSQDTPAYTAPIPQNIPSQVTPFIGRMRERRAIDNVLRDRTARLITIMGVGGSGKTRLAMAVGEQQLSAIERDGSHRFPDGVFFVPLESIESASEIVPTICRVFDFQPADESRIGRSVEEQLLDRLRRKQLLLIFDNFEHLLVGVSFLSKIRRSSPGVHLLITSRQKLALQGERLYGLDGLSYPTGTEEVTNASQLITDYSAANLFVSSAQRTVSDFELSDSDIPAIIRLCHLVDGLPLAIELAAGWTNVLSVADIVAEIEKGLSFLFSDFSDLPDRHRSMEAVFNVSWNRLAVDEQQVFAQLCVFRGGFTRLAAGKVVGATIRQLATLVNKALLQYDKKLNRYQIHRLLRQFGDEKLAFSPAAEKNVRDCHCSHYSSILQKWADRLKGPRQLETLAELEMESANVRSAWYYASENGLLEELDQAADGLGSFYLWRRRFLEGEMATKLAAENLQQLLISISANYDDGNLLRILAKIQLWQSVFCKREEAAALVDQACQTLKQPELDPNDIRQEQAFAWLRAGDMAFESDSVKAQDFYRRSLALYRELNDGWGVTTSLTAIGWLAAHDGESEKASYLGKEALKICRKSGDLKRTADALWLLGTLAAAQGQVEESGRLLGESLDIRASLGDRITDIAVGPVDLGMTLTWIGRMAEADEVREEALALYESQGQPEQIALAHVALATSKMHLGQYELSERHGRIGLALCKKEGNDQGAGRALWLLSGLALIDEEVDEAEALAQESLAYFQRVEAAAEIGWVLGLYAEIARRRNMVVEARNYLYQALTTGAGVMSLVTSLLALAVYINLIADGDDKEKAVELGALLEMQPILRSSGGTRMLFANRFDEFRKSLPPDRTAALEARGRARNLTETAAEIVSELEAVVV